MLCTYRFAKEFIGTKQNSIETGSVIRQTLCQAFEGKRLPLLLPNEI